MNSNNFIPQSYRSWHENARKRNSNRNNNNNNRLSHYESLKEAILHRDRGTIIWLINEGCPVNSDKPSERNTDSPLHCAVIINDVPTARILIAVGADVNAVNNQKQTPLHLAFEMGNTKMVDLLLKQCYDGKNNPFTVYGLSHFHIACVRNNWLIANSFLLSGVNANVYLEKCFYGKDYVYYRPLHLAVKYENLETAELLLKYGANINARDRYKHTPLHLACCYNCEKICEQISGSDVQTPGDVRYLVKSENNQVDIIKMLIRYKADIEALDANGTPPLFHVFKSDYRKVRSAIRKKLRTDDEELWNEVVEVLRDLQREKFYALVQRDVNIKFCDESKDTLVHLLIDGRKLFTNYNMLAVKERDLSDEDKADFIDLLLKYGAEVDAKNASGQTPLHVAISSYHVKVVKTLLNHYATTTNISFFHYKIPKRDAGGNFDLVDMENFLDIISLIMKRKSDLNVNRTNELLMLRYMAVESNIQHFENCSTTDLRHLLDFGDINSMNESFYLSERSLLHNREKVALVLEHIQKLEIAGLYVDANIKREFIKYEPIVEASQSNHNNQLFVEQCKEEIKKLKITMIDRYASFYDLLFLNVNEIAVRVKNNDFTRSVTINCKDNFTLYNNIIIKQFVKGLVRSILLESAKDHLSFIIKIQLPDPCSENILSHLKNEDLCNLALAFEKL